MSVPPCLDPEFRCNRYLDNASLIYGRLMREMMFGHGKVEVIPEFCYLDDMLSAEGSCDLAVITHTWVKVFMIYPEFRILRLTFLRKSASKC